MTKFSCEECGYSFDSGLNQTGKGCPYCGKKKVEKEKSAEDLVREG